MVWESINPEMAEENLERLSKLVKQHPLGPLDAEISLEDASKEKPDTAENMWTVVAGPTANLYLFKPLYI